LVAFGIEGDFDVMVFEDVRLGLFGWLVPEHHFFFDFLGEQVDLSFELK
jgi:hypothetical protein